MKKIIVIFLSVCVSAQMVFAQPKRVNPWHTVDKAAVSAQGIVAEDQWVDVDKVIVLTLDTDALRDQLRGVNVLKAAAPAPDVFVELPMPSGELITFKVSRSGIMHPDLAAAWPEIRSYRGVQVDDPFIIAWFDLNVRGFHGQIKTPDGYVYIDPVEQWGSDYICFHKRNARKMQNDFTCKVKEIVGAIAATHSSDQQMAGSGNELHTFRLACAATGEYTSFHGGSVGDGLAAIVVAWNRVSGIYEIEAGISFELVANNDDIVYTNGGSDPYSNNDGDAMLGQNQSTIDSVIGDSNYDVGHVFSTGGGGVAYLEVICDSGWKAQGVTGRGTPIGDAFYVDYVAHEMGHQFGGNHTLNGKASNCSGNRTGSAAYEPGSASTIMGYAGICGGDNLQNYSDPYFHTHNYDQINAHITAVTCETLTATGNNIPTIGAGNSYTIPYGTPFVLTGVGNDADPGDVLTYCWEQFDLGPAQNLGDPDNGSSPLFRSWNPTTDPKRYFPRMSDLLNNVSTDFEILPTQSRNMKFRCTVRDNASPAGGVEYDSMTATVVTSAGPFAMTSQNGGGSFFGNDEINVLWDVAGTSGAPVNASLVNILLSTNGGLTFDVILAANTANDGTETIVLPNQDIASARIKIEAVNNIFFDINNANVSITSVIVVPPDLPTNPQPSDGAVAVSTSAVLSWTSDDIAESHTVYFGTSGTPPEVSTEQAEESYNPGILALGTTYYWQIKEVNIAGTTDGPVWSFTTQLPTPGDFDADGDVDGDDLNDPVVGWKALYGQTVGEEIIDGSDFLAWQKNYTGSKVSVPDVVNLTVAAATTAITDLGLMMGTPTEAYHATIVLGNVISSTPPEGTELYAGDAVSLEVSLGPPPEVGILSDWTLGTTHAAPVGTNRALVLTVHGEGSSGIDQFSTATYGGQPMALIREQNHTNGIRPYVAMFILDDAGIAAAVNSTFDVTWTPTTSADVVVASIFLGNVDQTAPFGAKDGNLAIGATVSTSPLATTDGDIVILAATHQKTSGTHVTNNGFTTAYSFANTDISVIAGHKEATGSAETPSVTHTITNKRQVIVGAVIRHVASAPLAASSVAGTELPPAMLSASGVDPASNHEPTVPAPAGTDSPTSSSSPLVSAPSAESDTAIRVGEITAAQGGTNLRQLILRARLRQALKEARQGKTRQAQRLLQELVDELNEMLTDTIEGDRKAKRIKQSLASAYTLLANVAAKADDPAEETRLRKLAQEMRRGSRSK